MKRLNGKKLIISIITCLMAVCLIANPVLAESESAVYVDRKADVVFIIDATGSMGNEISTVRNNITAFLELIKREDVDVRTRFVVYRDITCSEPTVCSNSWFSDTEEAKAYLSTVRATGGGDREETLWDAFGMALADDFGYRDDAVRFSIVLTDADNKTNNNYGITSSDEIIEKLNEKNICNSMITGTEWFDFYRSYVSESKGGILADINGNYAILLKGLADVILDEVNTLCPIRLTPAYCTEGNSQEVTVTFENPVSYEDNFAITMNGRDLEVTDKKELEAKFIVPDDVAAGKYPVTVINGAEEAVAGNFTVQTKKTEEIIDKFEDGDETGTDDPVDPTPVDPEPEPVVEAEITSISPTETVEGTSARVKVYGKNFTYDSDSYVMLGDTRLKIELPHTGYFYITVPATTTAGNYDIMVHNALGKDASGGIIGTFKVNAKPVILADVTGISPSEITEGTSTRVKITGKSFEFKSGSYVMLGDTKLKIELPHGSYFYITVPATMAAGSYDIMVYNALGRDASGGTIGTFKVNSKPVIVGNVTGISPAETLEGTSSRVKITGKSFEFKSGSYVMLGDTKIKIELPHTGYFYITVPATMAADSYDIMVYNALGRDASGGSIGKFKVNAKSVVPAEITGISPLVAVVGNSARVKVTGSKFEFKSGCYATIGDTNVKIELPHAGYFYFTVPSTMAPGNHPIKVYNALGADSDGRQIGVFKVNSKPVIEGSIASMSPSETTVGTGTRVKVSGSSFTYNDGAYVKVGSTDYSIESPHGAYFYISIPNTVSVGTYDVTVFNALGAGSEGKSIGTFKVKAKPVIDANVTGISQTSVLYGNSARIKVSGTNFTYESDCYALLGTTVLKIEQQHQGYFYIVVPNNMKKGTYTISVFRALGAGDSGKNIGYSVTVK